MRLSPRLRLFLWISAAFFLAFVALRLGFYLQFLHGSTEQPADTLWQAAWVGVRFDLRMALLIALPVVLLTLLPGRLNPRRSPLIQGLAVGWLTLATLGCTLIYIFDFGHYSYLGERLNASVLQFAKDSEISLGMVWQSYPVVTLVALTFLVTAAAGWGAHRLMQRYVARPPLRRGWFKATVVTTVWVVLFVHGVMGTVGTTYPLRWSDAFFANDQKVASLALNPFVYFQASMKNKMRTWNDEILHKRYQRVANWLGVDNPNPETLNFSRQVEGEKREHRPNIVFIHLESLGANRMGLFGNPLNATPNLDRMGRNGVFFPNFMVPSSGTARTIFGLVSGIPDVSWGGRTASRNPEIVDQYTLINSFRDYKKLFFIGGSAGWANIRGVLQNNVPELELWEEGDYSAPEVDVWGISDRSLFQAAHRRLKQLREQKPFVAFITTAANHRPFTIPDDESDFKVRDISEGKVRKHGFLGPDQYNGARLLDYNVGYYIEDLVSGSWYEGNTIYIMYGDHNDRSTDTNHMGYSEALGLNKHHVPLIIYGPGVIDNPRVVKKPASLVDLLPTALGLAGLPYENRTLGRDLLEWNKPGYALTFGGNRHNNPTLGLLGRDYLFSMLHDGKEPRLYPLENASRDHEISDKKPDIAAERKALLEGLYHSARYMMYAGEGGG